MYHFWTAPDLKEAIVEIERKIASGATAIASPDAGSASFMSVSDARALLKTLYRRYEEKTGERLLPDRRFTVVRMSVRGSEY
ncbi:hypothetical protein SAMN06297251_10458 [Fulvimarina manganoxydans]|uniref:Uncharacterized protein n=1 Tax=Fulvimarina manganoxydans TaxID=937218 RepID=A0A1W2AC06_9HYPH|nr:hypothetical protein [Fulvimarina manganoxydans]SMC58174.1 hypothetical protein SAMN06297251_10458 [Fulvimarina manganoxydans]